MGYYLDLVIPRKEEPRKKIGSQGEIIAWKNITNQVINLLVKLTRISANLLVILVKNTSKLTSETNQIRLGGPSGAWGSMDNLSILGLGSMG